MITTPRAFSPKHFEFFKLLSAENEARRIKVEPLQGAQVDQCFYNVRLATSKLGGSIKFGWCIWESQDLWLEAEQHAVWQRPSDGYLIDITPKVDREVQIVFVEDSAAEFDFDKPNWQLRRYFNLSAWEEVENWISSNKKILRMELAHSTAVGGSRQVSIPAGFGHWYNKLKKEKDDALISLQHRIGSL